MQDKKLIVKIPILTKTFIIKTQCTFFKKNQIQGKKQVRTDSPVHQMAVDRQCGS